MNREIYKRVAPHLDRTKQDGGVTTDNMSDLFLLQRSNEQYKDYLKLSFCPELHGYKKDTRSNVDYITKGYSANSIQQELGPNLVVNGGFDTNSNWNVGLDGIFTITNGTASINNNSSGRCRFGQLLSTISGKKYRITFTINRVDRSISFITAPFSNLVAETNYVSYNSTGIKSYDFIATASNAYIGFLDDNQSTVNSTTIIDNVSLQEVLSNDLTQTSSANQPYLDKIAPAEKLSAKNPNGGSNYLTHPTISFGANDEWTIETTLLINDSGNTAYQTILGNNDDISDVFINASKDVYLKINSNYYTLFNIKRYIGKSIIITLCKKNNYIYSYVNGELISTNAITIASFNISNLGRKSVDYLRGNFFSYHIFSKALSASEVAERSAILRSIFPEIPFTRIGDQIWSVRNFEAVCTPQGNLIPEMQANGNIEKITNIADREFSSDTVFWARDTGITINGGTANFNFNGRAALYKPGLVSDNKFYKVTVTTNIISGELVFENQKNGINYNLVNGTNTYYLQASGTTFLIASRSNCNATVDNISIQEIGWSGSQELYDGIYAQTNGTVEQKTYAAVKAAAMWCHYGNDPALGAIYGKLYNWFAVKLLQMDIDYYNANNPTTPWGWRVPTQSDFNTLATTLGGASVAGGKMKTVGTTYWNSPNTGADNSSGFSAICGGMRQMDGSYNYKGLFAPFWNINEYSSTEGSRFEVEWGSSFGVIKSDDGANTKSKGFSLRLIKA